MPVPISRKLANARLADEVADHAAEERAVSAGGEDRLRGDLEHCLGGRPVGCVVVLTAEQVVVHPGLVRHAGVERRRPGLGRAAM